ncbi:hypothetical protein AWB73_04433 [Caballeronia turbans]|jgi:uncharacterized protein YjbJ (UPF0337 family)|nr:hypothetical protein AWB73_04433 [Caballeronia turbans]
MVHACNHVQEAIGSGAGDAMSQIKGRVGQVAGTTQEFAGRTVDIVRDQTGENPLAVLGIVAVSSFLLGLLIGSAGASKQLFR